MLPIVKQATEKAGVTAAYKQLMKHAGSISQFMARTTLLISTVTSPARR